jgi:hypothetical protein
VFALHGANEAGKPELLRSSVTRPKLHELVAGLPPCIIGKPARARTTGRGCSWRTATPSG